MESADQSARARGRAVGSADSDSDDIAEYKKYNNTKNLLDICCILKKTVLKLFFLVWI